MSAPYLRQTTTKPDLQSGPGPRRLPDGTWYDPQRNLVEAPMTPDYATAPKQPTSPTRVAAPIVAAPPAPSVQMLPGMDGLGAMPIPMYQIHMPQGRNYPALGQAPQQPGPLRAMLAIGAIIGVAALTVWLDKKFLSKKG